MRCPDGELEPTLELRREIVRVIRRLKPDVVVCQDPTVRWVDTQYINHPDHRAAGERRPSPPSFRPPRSQTFPRLLAEDSSRTRFGRSTSPAPRHRTWRSTSPHTWSVAQSLRAHVSQIGDWDPEPMVREWAKETAGSTPAMAIMCRLQVFQARLTRCDTTVLWRSHVDRVRGD